MTSAFMSNTAFNIESNEIKLTLQCSMNFNPRFLKISENSIRGNFKFLTLVTKWGLGLTPRVFEIKIH